MKAKITKTAVDDLAKGDFISDTEIRGFIARRLPSGTVSFGHQYKPKSGKRRWLTLGLLGNVTVDEARTLAKKAAGLVADRRDPAAEARIEKARSKNTVRFICGEWLRRYAREQEKLRSADDIEGIFERHIYPAIGDIVIYDLTRANVTDMLDTVAAGSGTGMAERVLAHLRAVINWWRLRDDDFITMPIVRGMARNGDPKRPKGRRLDIDEIVDIWKALDEIAPGKAPPFYPAYLRVLLLTATRRNELARMHTDELGDGNRIDDWLIPATRYKTKIDFLLPLPQIVRGMLPERRHGYVFSSDGGTTPFSGFSKTKQALDQAVARLRKREGKKPIKIWTLHDLRRTARSLMSSKAVGVNRDHAERVLGHVIKGVEGRYDMHDYYDEKRDALTKLATFVLNTINPSKPGNNVMAFPKGKKSARPAAARRHRGFAR